ASHDLPVPAVQHQEQQTEGTAHDNLERSILDVPPVAPGKQSVADKCSHPSGQDEHTQQHPTMGASRVIQQIVHKHTGREEQPAPIEEESLDPGHGAKERKRCRTYRHGSYCNNASKKAIGRKQQDETADGVELLLVA